MASARMISRDFFTSADLTDLPPAARLLFAGLIVYADDAGVVRHHPRFFQRTLLQGSRISLTLIEQWLDTLRTRNVLRSDILEGVKCWHITNFARFQRLKRREGKRREDEVKQLQRTSARQALDPKTELLELTDAEQVEAWLHQTCHFGSVKARKVLSLGVTMSDVKAWCEYEKLNGTEAMIGAIQGARNPDALPKKISGNSNGSIQDRERQAIQQIRESGKSLIP